MGIIHRFKGIWGKELVWEGGRTREYSQCASGATETWLKGKAEGAEKFAMRYYELKRGGNSREEQHPYDHGILITRGLGKVRLGEEVQSVGQGDVVYISPDERHQIWNTGEETLGWICIIPARRWKQGKIVWSEEGLDDLQKT